MKLILTALVALALVNGYKAQLHQLTGPPPDGLPTDPTIKPATQCGQTALTCYTDESKNGGLNTMLAQLKFAEGCRLVLVVMKCMDAEASKTECSGDDAQTEIETVRWWALDDIGDICNADGTKTACGSDAEDCIRNVDQVVVALSLHNITNTCPLFGRYKTCKDQIQAATECNTKVNAFFNQAEATMSEYQMLSGCESKCAQHIGLCTVNSTAFSLDYSTEKYCSDAKSMIICVNALKTNTDCQDTSDENQIREVDQAVSALAALASDVCTDDFQVAPCANHLMECYTELIGMTQDKTISNFDFCKKASQFEECAGTAGCENQLKNAAQTIKGKIMVLEEKYNCANEGDCSDQLYKCAELAVPLESVTKDTPISEICKTIKSGMDCLDVVKKDDTCIIETAAVQVIEDKFTPENKTLCGSGGEALASLSLAQQSVASPDIPPPTVTTTCGKKTLACYTSQQSNIDSVMKTFDFVNGCDVFGGVISCMENELNGGDCDQETANKEASDVRAWAKDDIGGICDESGTVTSCGQDIKGGFDDMQMALTDLKSANALTACPLFPKYTAWADNVRSKGTCTRKALETLNTLQSALAEDSLLANCDGPCAEQIGVCTENSTSYSLSFLGIDKYCQDALKVTACIKNLESSSQCKDHVAEVDMLEKVIATQENLASDVCDHGQPSQCATEVKVCYENILKLGQNPDLSVTEQCQDASLFLECMSRIPCSSAIKFRLNVATGAMQTLKIQQNCTAVIQFSVLLGIISLIVFKNFV